MCKGIMTVHFIGGNNVTVNIDNDDFLSSADFVNNILSETHMTISYPKSSRTIGFNADNITYIDFKESNL